MYKGNLALTNLQWLIYHKTQPNQYIGIKTIWHEITNNGLYIYNIYVLRGFGIK